MEWNIQANSSCFLGWCQPQELWEWEGSVVPDNRPLWGTGRLTQTYLEVLPAGSDCPLPFLELEETKSKRKEVK